MNLLTRKLGEMEFGAYASVDYLERRGTPLTLLDLEDHDLVGEDQTTDDCIKGADDVNEEGASRTVFHGTNRVEQPHNVGADIYSHPFSTGEGAPHPGSTARRGSTSRTGTASSDIGNEDATAVAADFGASLTFPKLRE